MAPAAEGGETWEKVEWSQIVSGGTYAITMTVDASAVTYILPNATSNTNPAATNVEFSGNTLTADANTYGWTFTADGSGYTISNGTAYLSPAYSANGVRVGNKQAIWTVNSTGNYLSTPDTSDSTKTWCMGVYNSANWRTYTTDPTSNNIKGQTLTLWHLQGETIAPETKVKTPTATPASGSTVVSDTTVTLSCKTAGVTYLTSTDGTNWTPLTGNVFTIPNDASGTYTIQVKATKDGLDESDALSLSYTIFDTSQVSTIAVARAGSKGTIYTVSGTVTLISSGSVYIQDDTDGICLRPVDTAGIERGKKITAYGTWDEYNNLLQLNNTIILKIEDGTLPTARETLISEITETLESQLIRVSGAKVTNVDGTTVTISQDEGATTTIYKCPEKENLTVGDTITVTAVVSQFKANYQLLVNSAEDISITDDVTPEEPGPGPVEPSDLYKPANGDKVALYYPSGKQVMTGEASGTRLKGAEASSGGGSLFVKSGTPLVLTASVDTDGNYTFTTADGRVLNTGATGGNMTLVNQADAVCTRWELSPTKKGDGWLVRSTQAEYSGNKNQYIEL